jgi:hypothetical protein
MTSRALARVARKSLHLQAISKEKGQTDNSLAFFVWWSWRDLKISSLPTRQKQEKPLNINYLHNCALRWGAFHHARVAP